MFYETMVLISEENNWSSNNFGLICQVTIETVVKLRFLLKKDHAMFIPL